MPALSKKRPLIAAGEHDPGPLAPALNFIDRRFGPIKSVYGFEACWPEPNWWVYDCKLARPLGEYFIDYPTIAMGCSIDPSVALRKALGEAIERYNAHSSMKVVQTKIANMEGNRLAERFPVCADFENCAATLKEFPTSADLTLVSVRDMLDDSQTWIPAGYVHLGFSPPLREPVVTSSISSGLAFHSDLFAAIWSSLVECAERDAIMTTWWNQKPASRIDIQPGTEYGELAERMIRLKNANLKAHIFDVTSDFKIPTVFCILEGESAPYSTVGGCCNSDPITACVKAIDEAVMIRIVQKEFASDKVPLSFETFDWIRTLEDRATLFAQWKNTPAFDFLFRDGAKQISLSEFVSQSYWSAPTCMDELPAFASLMQQQGLTALWSDITMDDVKEIGFCVKVVVPEMVPLTADQNACFLGTPRLAAAAGKDRLTKADINPYPHPFP